MRISRDSDHDPCPVTDDLLGELYRANKNGLAELIATVSPDVRAALALYCYRRGHMKGIGLAIASTCELYDLETAGGTAGAALFARSREAAPAAPVAFAIRRAAKDHAGQRVASKEPADRRRRRAGRGLRNQSRRKPRQPESAPPESA
jgi:hypothetical protein